MNLLKVASALLFFILMQHAVAAPISAQYDAVVTGSLNSSGADLYAVGTPFVVNITYDLQAPEVDAVDQIYGISYWDAVTSMSFSMPSTSSSGYINISHAILNTGINSATVIDAPHYSRVLFVTGAPSTSNPYMQATLRFDGGPDALEGWAGDIDAARLPDQMSGIFRFSNAMSGYSFSGSITGLHAVSPIPEPSTWVMTLAGFLALSTVHRRRAHANLLASPQD